MSIWKKIIFILLLIVVAVFAQQKNQTIADEKSGKIMLIGLVDRNVFADTNFSWWYEPEYNNYELDTLVIDTIKNNLTDDISIKIIFGTWCSDSRREVPRFLKLIDELKIDSTKLTLICVDRNKNADGINLQNLVIDLVPTFIIYKDEKEIGRIIETPKVSLEKDFKDILSK